MDYRTRNPDLVSEEGTVKVSGGATPDAYPHKCPYRPSGATREFFLETTLNFQRNKSGCCGTNDYRNIGPCNSKFRRCWRCLIEGKGAKSEVVANVAKGLCQQHLAVVGTPDPDFRPTRSVVFAPTRIPPVKPRPTWSQPAPARPATSSALPQKTAARHVDDVPREKEVRQPKEVTQPTQRQLTEEDFSAMPTRLARLSPREKQVALALRTQTCCEVAKTLGISEVTTDMYMHAVCRTLGIPKGNRHYPYDRVAILRVVLERNPNFGLVEAAKPERPQKQGKTASPSVPGEEELLKLFRSMTEGNRTALLAMVKELK